MEIIMIDVGQGDGFLIRTKGMNILLDCGSSSEEDVGKDILVPLLKYYGIGTLNNIIVSHPDNDHVNGIVTLLSDSPIKIQSICIAKLEEFQNSEFLKMVLESRIQTAFLKKGDFLNCGGFTLECIWPDIAKEVSGNNGSLVIKLNFGGFSALFTGDVGGEYEPFLEIGKIDLLKVAHHGSAYSTTEEFLFEIKPEIAFISCGKNNPYGHPSEKTLERLEKANISIFRTDLCGAVSLRVTKDGRLRLSMLAN